MNPVKNLIIRLFFRSSDLALMECLFNDGLLSSYDIKMVSRDYINYGYRGRNRLAFLTELSRLTGYGTSIAGVSRFIEEKVEA